MEVFKKSEKFLTRVGGFGPEVFHRRGGVWSRKTFWNTSLIISKDLWTWLCVDLTKLSALDRFQLQLDAKQGFKFRYKVKENYCSISPWCQAWAAWPDAAHINTLRLLPSLADCHWSEPSGCWPMGAAAVMAGDRWQYPGSQDSLLVSVIQTRHILSLQIQCSVSTKLDIAFNNKNNLQPKRYVYQKPWAKKMMRNKE